MENDLRSRFLTLVNYKLYGDPAVPNAGGIIETLVSAIPKDIGVTRDLQGYVRGLRESAAIMEAAFQDVYGQPAVPAAPAQAQEVT